MPKRKLLVLALLAAGLFTGEGLTEARFDLAFGSSDRRNLDLARL